MKTRLSIIVVCCFGIVSLSLWGGAGSEAGVASRPAVEKFVKEPIGTVHKRGQDVWIEIDRRYEDGLSGLEGFSHVWVFWWFDRNDTPNKRQTLQVHPRGDYRNPLTGVFATRSPARPNLIALTLCEIRSVEGNRIRLADIDAFDLTPVVDLKPYIPAIDRKDDVRLPSWLTRSTSGVTTAPSRP